MEHKNILSEQDFKIELFTSIEKAKDAILSFPSVELCNSCLWENSYH